MMNSPPFKYASALLFVLPVFGDVACGGVADSKESSSNPSPSTAAAPTVSPTPTPVPPSVGADAGALLPLTAADLPDLSECLRMPADMNGTYESGCVIDRAGVVHASLPKIATVPDIAWIVAKFSENYTIPSVFPKEMSTVGERATVRVYQAPGTIYDNLPFPEFSEANRVMGARAYRDDRLVVVKIDQTLTPGNHVSIECNTEGLPIVQAKGGFLWSRVYLAK